MQKLTVRGGARAAATLGLGLTLSLGSAPVTALAVSTDGTSLGIEQSSAGSGENRTTLSAAVSPTNNLLENSAVTMTQDGVTTPYESISKALENVKPYNYKTNKGVYTIALTQDVTEDVTIPAGVNVTIDLLGHTLTNASGHTITNKSTKTVITDSVGGGVVDNVAHGRGAVYNDINASVTLKGGTFSRSAEASTDANSAGRNSWYVLKNFGTMTINSGVTVKFSDRNPGYYSSLIGNGWQSSGSAEAGTNAEPKPSEGKNKATLTINGGAFTGGKITVKNDDYGVLNVKGGFISQGTDTYYAIYNANKATISGGTISAKSDAIGSQHYDGDANEGSLTVSGGSIVSESGSAVALLSGAEGTIEGGTFQGGSDQYVIDVDEGSTAAISAGTFVGATFDTVVNKEGSFVDRFGLIEDANGDLVAAVTNAQATVTSLDGTVTNYESLSKALSNAPAGSTVQLQEDVNLTKKVASNNYGVTLDLNGHNISSSVAKQPAVLLNTAYSADPVVGIDSTMRLINSKPGQGGEIKAEIPLGSKAGDSSKPIALEVGEGVILSPTDPNGDAVRLESAAYLVYSEQSAAYIKNGGFKVTAEDGDRIYGTYGNAVTASNDGAVIMLHDYTGGNKIATGSRSSTLDLGGNTYTYTGFQDKNNSIVDINNDGVTLTIKDGALVSTTQENVSSRAAGINMLYSNSAVILDGVTIEVPDGAYGIVTNGNNQNNAVTLTNSSLIVTDGHGIYFPSTGSVTIDNSTITAKYVGIQVCAGDLTIQGDKTSITVTGQPQTKTEDDGVIADGAAISIVEREGYQDLGTVSVKGGTFTSAEGVNAIKAYEFTNDNKTEQTWETAGEVVAVSGGSFSTPVPASLCADGLEPVTDGSGLNTVGVIEDKPVTVSDSEGNILAAYDSLESALAKAGSGDVIKLEADVELSERLVISLNGVTIDLNNHKIVAASDFIKTTSNSGNQLVSVDNATGVTLKNGMIEAGANNYHALNVWNSKDVTLDGLVIDHTKAYGGAPLIVGGSEVTVKNEIDVRTGANSWYGINVDSRDVNGVEEGGETGASLTLADGASVTVSGDAVNPVGVYVQNECGVDAQGITVVFGKDTSITSSDINGFVPVAVQVSEGSPVPSTIVDPENAGLVLSANGTYVPKPSVPVTPSAPTYDVIVSETEGGKVVVTPTRANEGDEVTITATPDAGQEVRSVAVTDSTGKEVAVKAGEKINTWTFEMPDGAVKVAVVFGCDGGELCPSHEFGDVFAAAWYHDAMDWAVEEGLLSGFADGTMGPEATLSRGQLATVLYRRAGEPATDVRLKFEDCDPGAFYAKAVAWAAEEGVILGYGDGSAFGPNDPVTREQLATILWRLAGEPASDAGLDAYPDAGDATAYAVEALEWAVENDVLMGFGSGELAPTGQLNRAMLAAMLMRLDA